MPTFKTLATSVGFTPNRMDMVTFVAHLRSISRINFNQFYPCLNCFLFKEDSQLIEIPKIRTSALSLVSWLLITPSSNPCQFLNCNNFTLRFSLINGATNVVVKPRLIASLTPRQPLPDLTASTPTRRAFRGFLLQRYSYLRKILSNLLNPFTIPLIATASNGKITPKSIPMIPSSKVGSGASSLI